MFNGLCAFPLTPMNEGGTDLRAFGRLVERLATAGVDSIGALGSTGSYAYLSPAERARAAHIAVSAAGHVPVVVGIGALRTRDVLTLADDAQRAGARGLLLAPMSYQKLFDDEVFELYETVSRETSLPLCVYDNPSTTNFEFSDELHGAIAQLPNVQSIKIPPVSKAPGAAQSRIAKLREHVPAHVSLGISGDASAATGLNAGCTVWYSVIGGLFPKVALAITRAAQAGDAAKAVALSDQLQPLWDIFSKVGGSLRVVAAAAEMQGLTSAPCLPLPLQAVSGVHRKEVAEVIDSLGLA